MFARKSSLTITQTNLFTQKPRELQTKAHISLGSLKLFLLLSKFYTPSYTSNIHQQDYYQKFRLFQQSTISSIHLCWVLCIAAAIWVATVYHIRDESRKVEQKWLVQSMSSQLYFPAAFIWLTTKHSMIKKILLNIQDHLIPPFIHWVD